MLCSRVMPFIENHAKTARLNQTRRRLNAGAKVSEVDREFLNNYEAEQAAKAAKKQAAKEAKAAKAAAKDFH